MHYEFKEFSKQIDNYIKKGDFYIDVDNLINLFETANLTIPEKNILLEKVHKYKLTLLNNLLTEYKTLKNVDDNNKEEINEISLEIPKKCSENKEDKVIKTSSSYNNDIKKYIVLIDSFNEITDYEILNDLIEENNFFNIINKIIAHYVLEHITLRKLKYEEDSDLFDSEEKRIQTIIENLKTLRYVKESDNLLEQNKLIYLQTDSGNINFLDDLEKIDKSYYSLILKAFNSIIDGTFKNNKRIGKVGEGFYSPLLQVRVDEIRIFYLKVAPNLYMIIDVIFKNFDKNKKYEDFIREISKKAAIQRSLFLEMSELEQKKIIDSHLLITSNIEDTLKCKKKVLS